VSDIASDTIQNLLNTSAVTTLVGTSVYPDWSTLADDSYPMIVCKIEGVTSTHTYGGTDSLTSCTINLACIGKSYSDAVSVANAVQDTLDGFSGTWGTTTIQGVFLNDDGVNDEVTTEPESEAILYFVRTLALLCWFVRTS
jgi:hypothetical protein